MKKLNSKIFREAAKVVHKDVRRFCCPAITLGANQLGQTYFDEQLLFEKLYRPRSKFYFEPWWGTSTDRTKNVKCLA